MFDNALLHLALSLSVCLFTLHPNLLYMAWLTYVGCLFFVLFVIPKISFASCSSAFLYVTTRWGVYSFEVFSTSICPISYPIPVTPPHCTLCNAGIQVWCDSRCLANGTVEGQALTGKSYCSGWNPKTHKVILWIAQHMGHWLLSLALHQTHTGFFLKKTLNCLLLS